MVKQLSPWCGPQDSNLPCYDFKSFVSCLWTTPTYNQISLSNLHYELYHTLLRLSSIFLIFLLRLISMGRNKRQQNKEPLQACLSFLHFEERCRSQQSFLVVRTLICFQQASSLFPDFQTMSNKPQRVVQDVRIELLFLFPKQGCYHYTSSCI